MRRIGMSLFVVWLAGCATTPDTTVQILPEGTLGALTAGNVSIVLPRPENQDGYASSTQVLQFQRRLELLQSLQEPGIRDNMRTAMRQELRRQGFTSPASDDCRPTDSPLIRVMILDAKSHFSSAVWGSYTQRELRAAWEVVDVSRGERLFQRVIESESKESWADAVADGLRRALAAEDFPRDLDAFVAADRDYAVATERTLGEVASFQEVYDRLGPAVIVLKNGAGTAGGTGFIVGRGGIVLTNHHVVEGGDMMALLDDGELVRASILCSDRERDVALVVLEPGDYPYIPVSAETPYAVTQEVYAIGAPLHEDLARTVTRGIISGIRRNDGRTWIQTDAPINPGNSGGPLLSENGDVVGIVTWKVTGGSVEGIGFAVPIAEALASLGLDTAGSESP